MLNYALMEGGVKKKEYFSLNGLEFSHTIEQNASEALNKQHVHDTYEILYVVNGRGKYVIEGNEFELKPRTLLLIKPFKYHCVEIDRSVLYDRYVIHFSRSILIKDALPMLDKILTGSDDESGVLFEPEALPQCVISVFDRILPLKALTEQESALCAKMILSELVVMLSVTANSKIANDTDALGARVMSFVNARLDKDVSLEAVARNFFVSKYYLCRAFKKYSGVSLHSYINHKRVMYAKQLIEAGETAATAAYKVGFGDYSAFYRTHIKILGVPPTLQTKKRSTDAENNEKRKAEFK